MPSLTQDRAGREIPLSALDWPHLVRPGDLVVWGQAAAEPTALTSSLMASTAAIGAFRVFTGISWTDSVSADHGDNVAFSSYCGAGNNRRLGDGLDILPIPYSELAATLAKERPVLLLGLAPGADNTQFGFGAACEYLGDLLDSARLVIGEVNEMLPGGNPSNTLPRSRIDLLVRTRQEQPSAPPPRYGDAERRIAARVAGLIEDGATLQIGIGGIPSAVLAALSEHRNLGVHSGLIIDEVAQLADAGVITNARKSIDTGLTVTGLLAGTRRLMDWADKNQTLALRPTRYTHDPAVLASIDRLTAINSAIEVDLTGQVNAEVAKGRYVGAVGGAGDFLRGAHRSKGGLPIIAFPSMAGGVSRIVSTLSGPVSTSRADAGIFVTENGVADLRGLTLKARKRRMLDIAAPEHAERLERLDHGAADNA